MSLKEKCMDNCTISIFTLLLTAVKSIVRFLRVSCLCELGKIFRYAAIKASCTTFLLSDY